MQLMAVRRYPPPWTVEEAAPCFIVRDHSGQALAFVYCEDDSGRRAAANLLTRCGHHKVSGLSHERHWTFKR
jgi:hypothetical protein